MRNGYVWHFKGQADAQLVSFTEVHVSISDKIMKSRKQEGGKEGDFCARMRVGRG